MLHSPFDLNESAHDEMIRHGFAPDWSPEAIAQARVLASRPPVTQQNGIRDLRDRLWSSIDNDSSRDLDQIELADRTNDGIRVCVGIADVGNDVPVGSPLDQHASAQTTTVYTAVRIFPMLPESLSTDLTSLNANEDRRAIVIDMIVDGEGSVSSFDVYRALVRNKAQLTYSGVGPWLERGGAAPPKIAASDELAAQLRLQDEAAQALRGARHRLGALDFDRVQAEPVIENGQIKGIEAAARNRATQLIEDFMIAANESMAQTLKRANVPNIRRVVRSPERWSRIVDLAARSGVTLPQQPDAAALARFLDDRRQQDPLHYPDLSLSVIKLLGPGEYVVALPGQPVEGHFGLAAHDYTHSTAPNRRFADLVTQRLLASVLEGAPSPYSDDQLSAIAAHCTEREDAARKVERAMGKRVAAVAYRDRRGESFDAIVTGVTPKGVFVRVTHPPIEGRLMRGEQGVDVGDRIRVTLLSTNPELGYIDFGR